MYQVGYITSGYKKEKRHARNIRYRLLLGLAEISAVIALYAWIGIQFASAAQVFIPN